MNKIIKRYTMQIINILVICAYIIGAIITPVSVNALSERQRKLINSGVYYYDIESSAGRCSNIAVDLIGNDNIEKIYNFFLAKGLTNEQAAGITGNAIQESGGDPSAVSRSGYRGIFQWDKKIRWPALERWTSEQSFDAGTLEGQLNFSWYEATRRGNIEGIKEHQAVDRATWYWGRFFEGAVINGSSSKKPLTNVQHLDQRIAYANEVILNYDASSGAISGSSSSSNNCAGGNGEDTRFIDGFTVYNQYDRTWRDLPYSSSTIGESGCGPAAMAMIITNITKQTVTPVDTADYAAQIGMYVEGVGSKWEIGPRLAKQWGLQSEPIEKDINAITAALREGKLIITAGKGAKPFTSGGHILVIRGVTADGKFRIGDSGHRDTSEKDWDPQFIINNIHDGAATYAIYQ